MYMYMDRYTYKYTKQKKTIHHISIKLHKMYYEQNYKYSNYYHKTQS